MVGIENIFKIAFSFVPMQQVVFYSWQSDLPNATNRGIIQDALEIAVKAISSDDTIALEPVIDRDTQGMAGSPDIRTTIFSKIEAADVFVADVSIVGKISEKKNTPNPNVLLECGFAMNALGYDKIILVFNDAFGDPPDLPFDLSGRRLITYTSKKEDTDRATPRKLLAKIFEAALRQVLILQQPSADSLFSKSLEAVENNASNKIIVLKRELKLFLEEVERRQPQKFSEGGSIEALLEGINATEELLLPYAKLTTVIAEMSDKDAALEMFKWFGKLIYKYDTPKHYQGIVHDYDFDYYKFLGTELLIQFIAPLVRESRWQILKEILDGTVPVEYVGYENGPAHLPFKNIYRFVGSLYYESKKQQGVPRQSQLLKNRHSTPGMTEIISFDDFMSGDLFLYLACKLQADDRDFFNWNGIVIAPLRNPNFIVAAQRRQVAIELAEVFKAGDAEKLKLRLVQIASDFRKSSDGNFYFPLNAENISKIGTIS